MTLKIIVGLGNPEPRYERTRHNAGFLVLDRIATKAGAEFRTEKKFQSMFAKCILHKEEVVLVKPLTYMNLSGQAVLAVVNWFKIPLEDLLVVHDDVSLPLGRIRLQKGGGAGGQHGIESIISVFGGRKEFDRIKVGVGPDPGGERRADYVLSTVPPADFELLETTLSKSCDAALSWIDKGLTTSMNIFNGAVFGVPEQLRKAADQAALASNKTKEDQ